MPVLTVRHLTTYRYRQPVSFGEHRMMLRPRDAADQRLLDYRLAITPEPVSLRWVQDVFGNAIALARFSGRAAELSIESTLSVEHEPASGLDLHIHEHAAKLPFSYDKSEMPDLARLIERQYPDPDRAVERWARSFQGRGGAADTFAVLTEMTHAIRRDFSYLRRSERGIQDPARTLALRTGSCRDYAVLMIEAVRALGLAARFVSGYVYVPSRDQGVRLGGGSTHAWVQVYVPGPGWIEFDPTNGIVGTRDLVRVAVAREPAQAVPLAGTWSGFPADDLGMTVEVHVTAAESAARARSGRLALAGA